MTFDRIVAINLDRRPDRWQQFTRQLDTRWPWQPPERFAAIDGRRTTPPTDWPAGKKFSRGAWGCYRSHLAVIERALADGVESLLILEDDAQIPADFAARAKSFLSRVPSNWQMLYFGGLHLEPPNKICPRVVRGRNVNHCVAYAIRGDALAQVYQHLIDTTGWQTGHVDWRLGQIHPQLKVYAPAKMLIRQAKGKSDISGKDTSPGGAQPVTSRGVITAANSRFVRTLDALVRSCRRLRVPIAIADHGLTAEHREHFTRLGAILLDGSRHNYGQDAATIDRQTGGRRKPVAPAEAWAKPLVCLDSPFDVSLWIDSDAILLRGADELFAATASGPWTTPCYYTTAQRVWPWHEPLIRALYGKIPATCPDAIWINSGVVGFRRGDPFLLAWRDICAKLVSNPDLTRLCRLRDQAALAAWLAGAPADAPRIVHDRRYNFPANGKSNLDSRERRKYAPDIDLLDAAAADHPEALIVHWMGGPKPPSAPLPRYRATALIPTGRDGAPQVAR